MCPVLEWACLQSGAEGETLLAGAAHLQGYVLKQREKDQGLIRIKPDCSSTATPEGVARAPMFCSPDGCCNRCSCSLNLGLISQAGGKTCKFSFVLVHIFCFFFAVRPMVYSVTVK